MVHTERDSTTQPGSARSAQSGWISGIVSPRVVLAAIGVLFLLTGTSQLLTEGFGGDFFDSLFTAITILQLVVGVGLLFMLRWAYYGTVLVLAVHLAVYYLSIDFLPLAVTIATIGIVLSYGDADWQ